MTRNELINKSSSYIKKTSYENPNQFTRWYFKNNKEHAWCGAFIYYCVKHDLESDMLDTCSNFAYCPTIYNWAKNNGYLEKDYTKAKAGDLVLFSFDLSRPEHLSHVGIVKEQTKDGLITIEGNTSNNYYTQNCVAQKTRNKKVINSVILLPYKEGEDMFKIGDTIECIKDTKLYTTVEEKESKYTIKAGDIAYVKYLYNNKYIALANPITKEYFISAWTKEISNFKLYEVDYKKLYETELEKNKILQDKINRAIEVLNG